jgi:hypothetical protein
MSEAEDSFGIQKLTTETSWRLAALERGKPTFWFFETLQSKRRDERLAVQRDVKAQERRFRGSTESRPER